MWDDLIALAERVVALSGPDREVDAKIACILRIGPSLPDWAKNWAGEWRPTVQGSAVLMQGDGLPGPHFEARTYTSSLDAAMTLVPEGWYPRIAKISVERWSAHLGAANRYIGQTAKAATPALALTAACFRALAAQEPPDEG